MTVNEDALRIAARLANAKAWTQGAAARDDTGREVSPWSASARSWCVIGAAEAEFGWGFYNREVYHAMVTALGGVGRVAKFNDTHDHAEVIDWLRTLK